MGRGLLITELMGQGVNIVTGDYPRGAAGFRIENGVIAYPLYELTLDGNLRDLFATVEATGRDLDPRSHDHTGPMLGATSTVGGRSARRRVGEEGARTGDAWGGQEQEK